MGGIEGLPHIMIMLIIIMSRMLRHCCIVIRGRQAHAE